VAGLIEFSVTPKHQDWLWGCQTSCPVDTEGLVHWGGQQLMCEADLLPLSAAEVKNEWNNTFLTPHFFIVITGTIVALFTFLIWQLFHPCPLFSLAIFSCTFCLNFSPLSCVFYSWPYPLHSTTFSIGMLCQLLIVSIGNYSVGMLSHPRRHLRN